MNIAVIFAGGIGTRMNSKALPKQFLKLYGKEIIIYTLEHFEKHPEIDAIAVACVKGWIPFLNELLEKYRFKKVKKVVPGGTTGFHLSGAESGRSYCAWREKYCSRTRRRTPADQWRTHYKLYPGCQG